MKFLVFTLLSVISFQSFAQNYEKEFKQRSALVLDFSENYGGSTPTGYNKCGGSGDYGKFLHAKMCAVFAKGPESEYYINAQNWMIDHKVCDLFHFNLFGLPYLFYGFPKEPSILESRKEYLEWLFKRTDGYNAFTGEGTENHINMCRPPAYLLCQLALEEYPEDAKTWQAAKKMQMMKDWIMYWSKRIYETGTGEFASTIYYVYDIVPWMSLYDYAKDPEVKAAAKSVVDYYASEVALVYSQGNIGGMDMRGSGSSDKSFRGGIAFLAWLWYGDTPTSDFETLKEMYFRDKTKEALHTTYGAMSSYRPPQLAVMLANNKFQIPAMYYNSKPGYLLENPSYIKSTFYRDSQYQLGAGYIPYGGWSAGCYATISWKLIARGNIYTTKSYQYISGQGMVLKSDGQWRCPFDQLVHHKNVMIQMTKVPKNMLELKQDVLKIILEWRKAWDADFRVRFPEDSKQNPVGAYNISDEKNYSYLYVKANKGKENYVKDNNILFLELDSIFVAIRSLQMSSPTQSGGTICDGTIEFGKLTGLVLEVGNRPDFKNFSDFRQKIKSKTQLNLKFLEKDSLTYKNLHGELIQIKYNENGTFTEPIYDWGFGPRSPLTIHQSPPFDQPQPNNHKGLTPWPSGKGHGKIATWKIDEKLVDLSQKWAVFEGPGFQVKNSILLLQFKGEEYKIDYSGVKPIFSHTINNKEVDISDLKPK